VLHFDFFLTKKILLLLKYLYNKFWLKIILIIGTSINII